MVAVPSSFDAPVSSPPPNSTSRRKSPTLEPAAAAAAAAAERSSKRRSRSLENLALSTAGAMWSALVSEVVLNKGDRGLGFSILDYQDPQNPSDTVIVIRSVIRGGIASQSKCLVPGDRLVYVNDTRLEIYDFFQLKEQHISSEFPSSTFSRLDNASLDMAVQALKGAPYGPVRLGIAKPVVEDSVEVSSSAANNNEGAQTASNNDYEEV